jgi:uncharacterized membrane protein
MATEADSDVKKKFEPLIIVGVFWTVFGIVVLFATLFVRETDQVPLLRGVVTNIIAGSLLLGVGIISVLKGRANQQRKRLDS